MVGSPYVDDLFKTPVEFIALYSMAVYQLGERISEDLEWEDE